MTFIGGGAFVSVSFCLEFNIFISMGFSECMLLILHMDTRDVESNCPGDFAQGRFSVSNKARAIRGEGFWFSLESHKARGHD